MDPRLLARRAADPRGPPLNITAVFTSTPPSKILGLPELAGDSVQMDFQAADGATARQYHLLRGHRAQPALGMNEPS